MAITPAFTSPARSGGNAVSTSTPAFLRRAMAHAVAAVFALPLVAGTASAASFTVTGSSSTARTLGANETGSVTSTGSLAVGGSTNAVTVNGNNAILDNQGTIKQTGTGRAIRDNNGSKNLTLTNGSSSNASALIEARDADVIQMNVGSGSVTLHNYGSMISNNASSGGAQAVDFNAITTGANVVNNYGTGLLKAFEADAVRPGVNGVVYNAGKIQSVTAAGNSSDGVDLQSNSGIQIVNDVTGLIEGGRHGVTGGPSNAAALFTVNVTNHAGGIIRGSNGSGINIDGVNASHTATIVNHGTILGNGVSGDGDGIDVDGVANITNTGIIRSNNAVNPPASGQAFSEGITVGGGQIINSGTIEGLVAPGNSNAVGRGITLAGNDIASGPLAGTREGIYANTVITNQAGGLIRGQTDSAIVAEGAASGRTVVINNNAGAVILGGGAAFAAVRTGADNDTLHNAGTINGGSSGKAIDLGAGNDSLYITGGNASVTGNISGGTGANTMVINAGAGNGFAYAGSISNFGTVQIGSGDVVFSGTSAYTGTTVVSGGVLTLAGANLLAAGGKLDLNGGTLKMNGVSGSNGQSFASLALTGNSFIDLGHTSFTFGGLGDILSGTTLTITEFDAAVSPDYAFRFFGDFTSNQDFLKLISQTTINGLASAFHFDGVYTDVIIAADVPEPETLAMLLAGLGLMGAVTRRRKKKNA